METDVDHFARRQYVLKGTNFLWLQKKAAEDDPSAIKQHWSALPCVNAVDKTMMRKAPADSPKNIDCSQHIQVQYGYQAASL